MAPPWRSYHSEHSASRYCSLERWSGLACVLPSACQCLAKASRRPSDLTPHPERQRREWAPQQVVAAGSKAPPEGWIWQSTSQYRHRSRPAASPPLPHPATLWFQISSAQPHTSRRRRKPRAALLNASPESRSTSLRGEHEPEARCSSAPSSSGIVRNCLLS